MFQRMAGVITAPKIAAMDGLFQTGALSSPGYRIAGGTDEILRNIIAERVLGLAQEERLDKDAAFRDLPTRGTRTQSQSTIRGSHLHGSAPLLVSRPRLSQSLPIRSRLHALLSG